MKVVATKVGFYAGHRIREGREFTLRDGDKLDKNWMRPVVDGEEVVVKKGKKGPEPVALSEMQNVKAQTFEEVVVKKAGE